MKRKRNIGSGLKALEAPPPKEGVNLADLFLPEKKSFLFDGPINTVPAGRPIPSWTERFARATAQRRARNLGPIPRGGLRVGGVTIFNPTAEDWRPYAFQEEERTEYSFDGRPVRSERTAKWTINLRAMLGNRVPRELTDTLSIIALEGKYWQVTAWEHYSRDVYDFHAREWFPPDE